MVLFRTATIRASIDLGTNTCLLLVVDWDSKKNEVRKVIGDFSTLVRLGEGVDRDRRLREEAMQRAYRCLRDYAAQIVALGGSIPQTLCVATSQARDAQNSSEFFLQIKKETGLSFQVISGEQEAQCTFLGALLPGMSSQDSCVVDIGGGSTELIHPAGCVSLDMGAVRFTERYLKSDPVTEAEFAECKKAIDDLWAQAQVRMHRKKLNLVGVAGTVTTLAAWHLGLQAFDVQRLNDAVLTRQDVEKGVNELKRRSVQERKSILAYEAPRADVILAGAMILWRVMEKLGFDECRVSTQGLRYGVLQKMLRDGSF